MLIIHINNVRTKIVISLIRLVQRNADVSHIVAFLSCALVHVEVRESIDSAACLRVALHVTFFLGVVVGIEELLLVHGLVELHSRNLHRRQRVAVESGIVKTEVARVSHYQSVLFAHDAVLFWKAESFRRIELRHEVAGHVSSRFGVAHLAEISCNGT